MFLSHYAAGLAAKKWAPKMSLGVLFLAAVWLDLLWSLFLLLGWGKRQNQSGYHQSTAD